MITVEFAHTLYSAEADSAHDFDHVLRVLKLAEKIAQAEGANVEIVHTAALLHDVGLEEGRAGHETSAANRAREILRDLALQPASPQDGALRNIVESKDADSATMDPHSSTTLRSAQAAYGDDFINAVAHAIESHRFRSGPTPQTLEAKVLFDADKLDAIGAIGVARAFAFGGHCGQRLWAEVSPDYIDQRGGAEADPREHTPVHEFHVKLSKIKDRMLTATGKRLAEERQSFMAAFYERLDEEVKGEK